MTHNRRQKVEFTSDSNTLAGLLEIPSSGTVAYALFAHCFTCGKDIAAATRIARSLVERGIAVLRFDFTGLGNSDGDFANSNFSSNVQDLIAAADFLRKDFTAPTILIGHSLGGTAVLNAANKIPEVAAVVTLGAPADATHVSKQFSCDIEAIKRDGKAKVNLAGRPFIIKQQFLDDISKSDTQNIEHLNKALLIMHSPVDQVVSIEQAEKIYRAAKHPKSFITLDTADHLISKAEDAEYVAEIIAAWATRYIPDYQLWRKESNKVANGEIIVGERNKAFTREVYSDTHFWLADEPVSMGGANLGPDPYEHLLAALGTCTSMTVRMYANRKQWQLDDITVRVSLQRKHGKDCEECDSQNVRVDVLKRKIELLGDLSTEQRERLLEIANRCPVHQTLSGKLIIQTK
ncbi:MAG: alpha/beta fold hydrolase [Gammaproteobacteria bacterium]|nr:alpha/beta fold hydrolase [Gammaproteobacteria bacterium]